MLTKIKKLGAMGLVFALLMGCLTACLNQTNPKNQIAMTNPETQPKVTSLTTDPETANETTQPIGCCPPGHLVIWSYTDEVKALALAFQWYNPQTEITYVEIPMLDSEYQNSVIDAANTDDCPDIIVMDSSFVKQFVDSDMLLDLSDLMYFADNVETYPNTIEMGTNFDTGEIRAFSYQNTTGAVFYRRSLAKEYFGTDDPEKIQAMMSDIDKFTDMAKTVKEKSDGKTFMVTSYEELSEAFFANREQPWFVDDSLVIDPIAEDYFDIAKTFSENGYDAGVLEGSNGWFEGMNDTLTDADGNPIQIFCYFLPTSGLPDFLMTNAPDLAGDWACCTGPLPYPSGGIWLGVMKNGADKLFGKDFVKECTMNEELLTNWATGIFINLNLLDIDPNCGDLTQPAGDFVSSKLVVDKITESFDDSEMSDFLGGQNYYDAFSKAAKNCSADMVREYDDEVQARLLEAVELYVSGQLTKEEAIASFKKNAEYLYSD